MKKALFIISTVGTDQNNRKFKTRLTAMEAQQVAEGLIKGASGDEEERMKQILGDKMGLVLVPVDNQAGAPVAKGKRTPGRKPAATTNPTDEEEADFLTEIRHIVGTSAAQLSKPRLLKLVLRLVSFNGVERENGLFFTREERLSLFSLSERRAEIARVLVSNGPKHELRHLPGFLQTPTRINVRRWLRVLGVSVWETAVKQSWECYVERQVSANNATPDAQPRSESVLYKQIKVALNIELETEAATALQDAFTLANSERRKSVDTSQCSSSDVTQYREVFPTVTVPRTLGSAASALRFLKGLIKDCWYCPLNGEIEALYLFARARCTSTDIAILPSEIASLNNLFLMALKRQRRGPFLPFADEEIDFGAEEW